MTELDLEFFDDDDQELQGEIARLEKLLEEAHDLLERYAPPEKFRTWEIASRCR